jgi:general secretion pathway protein G
LVDFSRLLRWLRRLPGMRRLSPIAALLLLVLGLSCTDFTRADRARATAAHRQIEHFMTALEAYRRDVGRYPPEAPGLAALWRATAPGWRGPYLVMEPPLDPWGHPYLYRLRPDGTPRITRR